MKENQKTELLKILKELNYYDSTTEKMIEDGINSFNKTCPESKYTYCEIFKACLLKGLNVSESLKLIDNTIELYIKIGLFEITKF